MHAKLVNVFEGFAPPPKRPFFWGGEGGENYKARNRKHHFKHILVFLSMKKFLLKKGALLIIWPTIECLYVIVSFICMSLFTINKRSKQ